MVRYARDRQALAIQIDDTQTNLHRSRREAIAPYCDQHVVCGVAVNAPSGKGISCELSSDYRT